MSKKNKELCESQVNRKIILFFLENEGSIDTARGIATWTNEDLRKVRCALEELAQKGILKANRTCSTVGYSCPLPRKSLTKIANTIKK